MIADHVPDLSGIDTESRIEARDGIGRDFHDDVIQRLFTTALGLHAAAEQSTEPEIADRLQQIIDEVDATINQLRTTIFRVST